MAKKKTSRVKAKSAPAGRKRAAGRKRRNPSSSWIVYFPTGSPKSYGFLKSAKKAAQAAADRERVSVSIYPSGSGKNHTVFPRKANPDLRGGAWLEVQRLESAYARSYRENGATAPATIAAREKYKAAAAEFRKGRKANPKGKKKPASKKRAKKNPSLKSVEAAGKMFKKFTGAKADRVRAVTQKTFSPGVLADCGRLVELVVKRPGERDTLTFNAGGKSVHVGTPADGRALYFVGGDQEISLRGLGDVKPQMLVGEVVSIVYFTSKDFHDFEPSEYKHKFGEVLDANGNRVMAPDAERPLLGYDTGSKRLYLVGGSYRVKRAGIVK